MGLFSRLGSLFGDAPAETVDGQEGQQEGQGAAMVRPELQGYFESLKARRRELADLGAQRELTREERLELRGVQDGLDRLVRSPAGGTSAPLFGLAAPMEEMSPAQPSLFEQELQPGVGRARVGRLSPEDEALARRPGGQAQPTMELSPEYKEYIRKVVPPSPEEDRQSQRYADLEAEKARLRSDLAARQTFVGGLKAGAQNVAATFTAPSRLLGMETIPFAVERVYAAQKRVRDIESEQGELKKQIGLAPDVAAALLPPDVALQAPLPAAVGPATPPSTGSPQSELDKLMGSAEFKNNPHIPKLVSALAMYTDKPPAEVQKGLASTALAIKGIINKDALNPEETVTVLRQIGDNAAAREFIARERLRQEKEKAPSLMSPLGLAVFLLFTAARRPDVGYRVAMDMWKMGQRGVTEAEQELHDLRRARIASGQQQEAFGRRAALMDVQIKARLEMADQQREARDKVQSVRQAVDAAKAYQRMQEHRQSMIARLASIKAQAGTGAGADAIKSEVAQLQLEIQKAAAAEERMQK